jgi:hypothetical protein
MRVSAWVFNYPFGPVEQDEGPQVGASFNGAGQLKFEPVRINRPLPPSGTEITQKSDCGTGTLAGDGEDLRRGRWRCAKARWLGCSRIRWTASLLPSTSRAISVTFYSASPATWAFCNGPVCVNPSFRLRGTLSPGSCFRKRRLHGAWNGGSGPIIRTSGRSSSPHPRSGKTPGCRTQVNAVFGLTANRVPPAPAWK